MNKETKYFGKDETIIFVERGLGDEYGIFRRSASGGLHRLKSSELPMTASRADAQKNLDVWAKRKGLRPV